MTQPEYIWADAFYNRNALLGPFQGQPPSLDKLNLAQIVLETPGDLRMALEFKAMPEKFPERWRAKEFNRLQLRIELLEVKDVRVSWSSPLDADCSARFEGNRFFLLSDAGRVIVEAAFFKARGEFFAYAAHPNAAPENWLKGVWHVS